jgi:hypothetical protein
MPQAMFPCPCSGDRVIAPDAAPKALSCAGWTPAASVRVWNVPETATVPIKIAAIAAAESIFTARDIMVGLV